MNTRQKRMIERQRSAAFKLLSPYILMAIVALALLVVGVATATNTLLGDHGYVCSRVSADKSIELGCK